jgi:hypothetical protein
MASKQLKQMHERYASIKERVSKSNLDLATNGDSVENLHLLPLSTALFLPNSKD